MINVALYHPQIPQNTGTLLRLASCLGFTIDLIRPFGFVFEDKKLKRAGMDYISMANYRIHDSFDEFLETYSNSFAEPTISEDFLGDTQRRTGAYFDVREDSSGGSTTKIPDRGRLCRRIIALESNDVTTMHHNFSYKSDDILLVGSEHYGFLKEDLVRLKHMVKIPMLSQRRSINMAVAATIVIGEAMSQLKLYPLGQ
ncbi:tRNA (cytidine(34)-2'-O)-methyltransferase [Alphaproteobacteria bacterium]|nr:tRNA (cytidine(34)-2'-O)-methyltransferase [Alphaproteobacteria bacterium]